MDLGKKIIYSQEIAGIVHWEGFDGLLGAKNNRQCLSLLHAEFEAFIWAMECMLRSRQLCVTYATDCS